MFNKMIMGGAFLLLTQIFVSNFKEIFAQGNISYKNINRQLGFGYFEGTSVR